MTDSIHPAPSSGADSTTGSGRAPEPQPRRRASTIVWGVIVAAIGTGMLARALGADFDNELAIIVLLAAAGVALLGTSVASAVRRRDQR